MIARFVVAGEKIDECASFLISPFFVTPRKKTCVSNLESPAPCCTAGEKSFKPMQKVASLINVIPSEMPHSQGYEPGESPDDLKKIIGELTVQNEILKKASGLLSK
jgi:hypothetical protein